MAAYPSTPGLRSDYIRPIYKLKFRATEAGGVRGSDLSNGDAYEIQISHPYITSGEMATLQSFYDTNRASLNTITLEDGNTYEVYFQGDYQQTDVRGQYLTAIAKFIATRQ